MGKKAEIDKTIYITDSKATIAGTLVIPETATGIVLFAHGSGSSRFSPRNNYVAAVLRKNNLATLLMDLLTPEEDSVYEKRFDISLLSQRLSMVTQWVRENSETAGFKIGYFGASTGAAAAIQSAATAEIKIDAIVSRGGRPDLAMHYLKKIKTPTLFIVGGLDDLVLELNKEAFAKLTGDKKMVIVEGATHLFEEEGTLAKVADLAAGWLKNISFPID